MASGDSGVSGILGVIVGVILVLGLIYFVFGESIGMRSSTTTVNVQAPKVPGPTK